MKLVLLAALTFALAGARVCEQWELDDVNFRRSAGPPYDQSAPSCNPSPSLLRTSAPIHIHDLMLPRVNVSASIADTERGTMKTTDAIKARPAGTRKSATEHEFSKKRGQSHHLIHLSIVQSFADWCEHPCMQSTWETAAPKADTESDAYRLYEAAIWRQEDPPRLALYEFDPRFAERASNSWELCGGAWECGAFLMLRESYKLLDVTLDGDLSTALQKGFAQIFNFIAKRSQAQIRVITYSGHGGAGDGAWFEGSLEADHAEELFRTTQNILKWDVMNFGTNCEEGQWNMLEKMHPFAKYIIASDLKVGGWEDGGKLSDEDQKTMVRMHKEWSEMVMIKKGAEKMHSAEDILKLLLEGRSTVWAKMKSTAEHKHRQSMSVYETAEALPFRAAMRAAYTRLKDGTHAAEKKAFHQLLERGQCDVLVAVKALEDHHSGGASSAPALESRFLALRVMYKSTADIFKWSPPVSNGLRYNWVEDYEGTPPCAVGAFFDDAARVEAEKKYLRDGTSPS